MQGYAVFKGHLTRREEKGVFGIPFRRLLGCGLGAAALYLVWRLVAPDSAVLPGIASLLGLLVLTAPQGGIPRWRHLTLGTRWALLSAAALAPGSMVGKLGVALGLPAWQIDLDMDVLFSAQTEELPKTALTDWVSFTRLAETATGAGLALDVSPGLRIHQEAA